MSPQMNANERKLLVLMFFIRATVSCDIGKFSLEIFGKLK